MYSQRMWMPRGGGITPIRTTRREMVTTLPHLKAWGGDMKMEHYPHWGIPVTMNNQEPPLFDITPWVNAVRMHFQVLAPSSACRAAHKQ